VEGRKKKFSGSLLKARGNYIQGRNKKRNAAPPAWEVGVEGGKGLARLSLGPDPHGLSNESMEVQKTDIPYEKPGEV